MVLTKTKTRHTGRYHYPVQYMQEKETPALKTKWMRRHQKEHQTKRGQKDIIINYIQLSRQNLKRRSMTINFLPNIREKAVFCGTTSLRCGSGS
jgi:hypothetical protein